MKGTSAEKEISSSYIPPINPLNSINFLVELTKFIGLTGIFLAKNALHRRKSDDVGTCPKVTKGASLCHGTTLGNHP